LSIGFYRHFFKIFFKNFFSSIKLILKLAIAKELPQPLIYTVKISSKNHFNLALLMTSLNMTAGLFCIGAKEQKILVHAIDDEHFKQFDLQKVYRSLNNVNDDNLV
jgi:multisubunit Na+/H+ antiporter MnhE subunit